MSSHRTEWIERAAAIDALCSQAAGTNRFIGGRFVFASEAEEDRRARDLTRHGFTICDTGQCELVAGRVVAIDPVNVREMIGELPDLAAHWGTRLQSIEAGTPETGDATILAAEAAYQPWWKVR